MTIETIIRNLRNIVDEWREASEDQNLEETKTSVKLILNDVCNSLGIEPKQIGL
ncbi:hypothetical protein ACFLY4_08575 [Chloroflexota bacterium]